MVRKHPNRNIGLIEDQKERLKAQLKKEGYGLVGDSSAVKICHWTKNSLKGCGVCFKEQLYGISSAGCAQISVSLYNCEHNCVHCWRNVKQYNNSIVKEEISPIEILDGIVEKRKKLLMGFKGSVEDLEKFEKALTPSLYTFSLSGEATLYSRIGEMFKEIRKRVAVSFLVTNGMNPEVLRNLKEDEFPTQITLSVNAPNKLLYNKWHQTKKKNAWKVFNEAVDVLRNMKGKTRRVIRLTLVNRENGGGIFGKISNMNEENILEYISLIKRVEPEFIHVKGFKSIGYARERLNYDKQPWFDQVKEFSKKLNFLLEDYEIKDEKEESCMVALAKKGVEMKIMKV